MADKKESALGAVTDFAQARVLDASGASKNIDKATMASVLAEEMVQYNTNTINGHKIMYDCVGLVSARNYATSLYASYFFWYSKGAKRVFMYKLGGNSEITYNLSDGIVTFTMDGADEYSCLYFGN